jgi:pimeloyl-ACP methyl ester carboxylesterase
MTKKAQVMLVHGAWADGSCWGKVILLLQAKGITVTAAQIPLTSLTDDIAVTKRLLSMNKEPTVLVGHSYGGAVITGAAGSAPQVQALVYITAFGLDQGESLESLSKQGPPSAGSAAITPDGLGYLWINREQFRKAFVADATKDEAAIMAAVQRPLSLASFAEKEGAPAWKAIPSWYLVCTDDQMIPPPAQEFLAKRMKATVRSVASSHAAFMAHSQEVANIILEAVEAASARSAAAA